MHNLHKVMQQGTYGRPHDKLSTPLEGRWIALADWCRDMSAKGG
jgi:hypothetical protein